MNRWKRFVWTVRAYCAMALVRNTPFLVVDSDMLAAAYWQVGERVKRIGPTVSKKQMWAIKIRNILARVPCIGRGDVRRVLRRVQTATGLAARGVTAKVGP